ncbi:MAG: hypothetical protein ABW019_05100 [Chitinophagaceae bacterium]
MNATTTRRIITLLTLLLTATFLHAQQPVSYPRAAGYISVIHPLVTLNKDGATYNFSGSYTVGFPCGVNVLKSDKIGYSFELVPFINANDSASKVSNFLFHPGVMFRYPKGFTFITRLAFETAGRYGFSTVFNKVVIRTKMNSYFVAMPLLFRFGNNKPASVATGLQLGVNF